MATGNGWYLIGPLIAVGLVGFLGVVFWRLGLQWTLKQDEVSGGLAIFDDFGLLCPATVTEDAEAAGEIRRLLATAGIRATQAVDRDGRTVVLVFAEELDEARRALKVV